MDGGVLLEGWCQLLLDGLVAGGLGTLVLSPGSRSTPLVLAATDHPGLETVVIVDERAAAFYALGLARSARAPVGLVRTSGSAAGHDLPAVIEARAAGLPLVVLTADRPHELMEVRAPQTIDQTRLFGTHGVGFFELGAPDDAARSLRAVRRAGAQAAFVAQHPTPGAVQVNVRARKPLEPAVDLREADHAFRAKVARLRAEPAPVSFLPAAPQPSEVGLEALRKAWRGARRPLIVAGPEQPLSTAARAVRLAMFEALGAPTMLETTSQLRLGPAGRQAAGWEAVFRAPGLRDRLAPDLVLQLGEPPVSTGLQRALEAWGGERWVVAPRGYPDPNSRARLLSADITAFAEAFRPESECDPEYLARWREAEGWAQAALSRAAARPGLGEGDVVRAARAAVEPGGQLAVGNSLVVRHLDVWVEPGGEPVDVLHQRGASGIDGLVAGALGASRTRPTVLLLGDVSARHDLGALALAHLGARLKVVVVHNGGGRIFEQLPLAKRLGDGAPVLEAFLTPDARSLVPVATALGWRATAVRDLPALRAALAGAGPLWIEAHVEPHEARDALEALIEEVEAQEEAKT